MKIGMIGAGYVSQAVAALCVAHGHEVMLSNSRGPDTLADLAAQLGCSIGTAEQAAQFGHIVLLALPFNAYRALPADLLKGKIVLDATNYYPQRDGAIAALDQHLTTTSELVAAHLPQSTVVKAFNAILAQDVEVDARPAGTPGRRALPIAGDVQDVKNVVAELIDQLGYDVVDTGPLADSWRFERAMPCYCQRLDLVGLEEALARAERGVEVADGSWRNNPS